MARDRLMPGGVALAPEVAVAAAPGSDFYYASLYFPPATRHALRAIEACRQAICAVRTDCRDAGVAHVKLAWWYDELGRLETAAALRHPLVRALAPVVAATPALKDALMRLVERVDASLFAVRPTRADVLAAIDDEQGELLRHYIAITGAESAPHTAALLAVGCRTELAYALQGLRQHRHSGPLPLAGERLAAHGLVADDVRAAHRSSELGTLLAEEVAWLAADLVDARAALPRSLRRRQRLLCTLAAIAVTGLRMTMADGCQLLERRIELLPVHKLWLAWRTRRFG